jgi:hypothetical protein
VSKEDYDIEIDGEKQLFICKKCENISMTIAHLSVHLERKHGITTGTYVCDICGRQCNSQENLRNHIRYVNILDHIFFWGGGYGSLLKAIGMWAHLLFGPNQLCFKVKWVFSHF